MNWKIKFGIAALAAVLALGACGSDGGNADSGYSPATGPSRGVYFGGGGSSYDPMQDVYDEMDDTYFDNCQWAEGCGMLPGAWRGDDLNSITGGNDLVPIDDGYYWGD